MTITYFADLVRIITQDVLTDRQNLTVVQKYVAEITDQKETIFRVILHHTQHYHTILSTLLQSLSQFASNDIELPEYEEQRAVDLLVNYIEEKTEQIGELDSEIERDWTTLELLGSIEEIPIQEYKFLSKNGYRDNYKALRSILQTIQTNTKLMTLLKLQELYTELEEVEEDLKREERKYQTKIRKESQGAILNELTYSRENYRKDTILLVEGLLQLDDLLYPQLKGQLDDYYRTVTHEKMVKLNKLVSMNTKVVIEEERVQQIVQSYRNKITKLLKNCNSKSDFSRQ